MIRDAGKKKGTKIQRKAKIAFLAGIFFALCIFIAGLTWAQVFKLEYGILSERYLYPMGLRLDVDSKLQWWSNIVTSSDYNDKREGRESLKGTIQTNYQWFGLGIIWDPNNDDQPDAKNMTLYANGSLKFWMKANTPLKVGIKSGPNVERWVRLDQAPFNIPSDNQWRFVSIPMSPYFNGIDFTNITQLFMISQSYYTSVVLAGQTFHFDNVRWANEATGSLNSIEISPSTFTVQNNSPKAFLAQGYDSNNNTIDVYPSWSKSGVNGSFNTANGRFNIFRPTSISTSATITATDSVSGNSNIQSQDIEWNDFFNLVIDEGVYGSIGTYDSDGTATANRIELSTVTYQTPPGYGESIRARYWTTAAGYAGFFVQEGELTDTTSTKSMSGFSDGYINFWIRTPTDLQISLRSINIDEGFEMSKVRLSDYGIPADNNWHEVYIALDDFELWDSRIEISAMKVFFNIAVVGQFASVLSDDFFISNIRYVRRKETTPDISVNIKKRSDNQIEPSGQISFSGAQLGGGWKMANQYLEIAYDTVDPSWGAQVYTDNMGTTASPKYSGDPTRFRFQQPGGLIGEGEPFLTCPMAWMALDAVNPNVPIPVETTNGLPPSDPDHSVFFESDTGGMWGPVTAESEWLWLKDRSVTKWDDKNGNSELDLTGNFGDPNYELVADFSSIGDEYSTFISPIGISTGWGDVEAGTRQYILNPESPIVIYMASKFQRATVLQRYKTNTITLELFHY